MDPLQNGYYENTDGKFKPVMTDALPAPKAIIEMVSCQCKKDCSSHRCSCKMQRLTCTDLCQCSSACENDEDTQKHQISDNDEEDDDYMEDSDSL
jgi:hypothetical protein